MSVPFHKMPRLRGGGSSPGRPEQLFQQRCDRIRHILNTQYHVPITNWAPSELLIRRYLGDENNPRNDQEAATTLAIDQSLVPIGIPRLQAVQAWLLRYWQLRGDGPDRPADYVIGDLNDPGDLYLAPWRTATDMRMAARSVVESEDAGIRGQVLYAAIRHTLSLYHLSFDPHFLTDLTDEDIEEHAGDSIIRTVHDVNDLASRIVHDVHSEALRSPRYEPSDRDSGSSTSILEDSPSQGQNPARRRSTSARLLNHEQVPNHFPQQYIEQHQRVLRSPFRSEARGYVLNNVMQQRRSQPPSPDARQADPRRHPIGPSQAPGYQSSFGPPLHPEQALHRTANLPAGFQDDVTELLIQGQRAAQSGPRATTTSQGLVIPDRPCHPCPTFPGEYHHFCDPAACRGLGGVLQVVNYNHPNVRPLNVAPPRTAPSNSNPRQAHGSAMQSFQAPATRQPRTRTTRPLQHHTRHAVPDSEEGDDLQVPTNTLAGARDSVGIRLRSLRSQQQAVDPDEAVASVEEQQQQQQQQEPHRNRGQSSQASSRRSVHFSPSVQADDSGHPARSGVDKARRSRIRSRSRSRAGAVVKLAQTEKEDDAESRRSRSRATDTVRTRSGRVVKKTKKDGASPVTGVRATSKARGTGRGRGRGK